MSNAIGFRIHKFWTEYDTSVEPPKAIEWVEYGPIGMKDKATTKERVSRLKAVLPQGGKANMAVAMAHARWQAIEPHYLQWKLGQEAPVDGTPLAAWNGVDAEQADAFKMAGIRSVEEIAQMNDTVRSKINLPRLSDIVAHAKRYIASADSRAFAAQLASNEQKLANTQLELAERDEQIRDLQAKFGQLVEMMAEAKLAAEANSSAENVPLAPDEPVTPGVMPEGAIPAPPRRGRPPRAQAAA